MNGFLERLVLRGAGLTADLPRLEPRPRTRFEADARDLDAGGEGVDDEAVAVGPPRPETVLDRQAPVATPIKSRAEKSGSRPAEAAPPAAAEAPGPEAPGPEAPGPEAPGPVQDEAPMAFRPLPSVSRRDVVPAVPESEPGETPPTPDLGHRAPPPDIGTPRQEPRIEARRTPTRREEAEVRISRATERVPVEPADEPSMRKERDPVPTRRVVASLARPATALAPPAPPSAKAEAPPPVAVSIGRIEIEMAAPPAPAPKQAREPRCRGFEGYARARRGRLR